MELFKKIVEIDKDKQGNQLLDEKGSPTKKRFTNFFVRVDINGNVVDVPITPVNFGEKSNRRNYNILQMSATLWVDETQKPY